MLCRSILACALGWVAVGCGDDGGGGGGVSELFDALSGDYVIHEGAGCVLEVRGSKFITRGMDGSDTCTRDQTDFGGGLQTLKISGTFSDTRVSGALDYVNSSPGFPEEGTTVHATATVNKTMGRDVDGRFAALAGQWAGTATYRETEPDGVESGTVDVFADVSGDSALVGYEDSDGNNDVVNVQDEGASGISFDGEFVSFDEF